MLVVLLLSSATGCRVATPPAQVTIYLTTQNSPSTRSARRFKFFHSAVCIPPHFPFRGFSLTWHSCQGCYMSALPVVETSHFQHGLQDNPPRSGSSLVRHSDASKQSHSFFHSVSVRNCVVSNNNHDDKTVGSRFSCCMRTQFDNFPEVLTHSQKFPKTPHKKDLVSLPSCLSCVCQPKRKHGFGGTKIQTPLQPENQTQPRQCRYGPEPPTTCTKGSRWPKMGSVMALFGLFGT